MNKFEMKIMAAEVVQAKVREEKDKDYSTVRIPKRWKSDVVTVILPYPDEDKK